MPDTGWLRPIGGTVSVDPGGPVGVTPSNVSNIANEDSSSLSVNLQSSGAASLRICKRVHFDWSMPEGVPENAELVGIEIVSYAQYDNPSSAAREVMFFELRTNQTLIQPNVSSTGDLDGLGYIDLDSDASPVTDNPHTFGGATELFDEPSGTLVSDFMAVKTFEDDGHVDRHAMIRLIVGNFGGFISNALLLGHIKMKLHYYVPPTIDMASTPSFSASLVDTNPILADVDIPSSAPSFSVSLAATIIANPYTLYSDMGVSAVIAADISETGWIDSTVNMAFSVVMDPGLAWYNDIYAEAKPKVTGFASIGRSNALSINFDISVDFDPQLSNRRELQTDAINPWFSVTMDAPEPDGTIQILADAAIAVTMDGDGMLVNWALYAAPILSVSVAPAIEKSTNLYTDMQASVGITSTLVQSVSNMAAAMSIGSVLFNTKFLKLPVPTLAERTIVFPVPERTLKVPAPRRTLVITSQQRN